MGSRFCKNCGAEIPGERPGNCPKCGAAHSASGVRNPVLAAVLSFIIPGFGQSYNGNAIKGIGIFLGVLILWILSLLMYSGEMFIGILVLWIFGVFDAYRDSWRMNRGDIPEKEHQILLFGGVAVVAVVILAVVFTIIFGFIALSGFAQMYAPVVCVPEKGCIVPLEGEAVCNTSGQCIDSAQTRIAAHYYNDAMKFLDRALALDPQNTHALTLMGIARAKSGNLTGAIIPLDRAVAIAPDLSAAWENRGIVQAMSGKNAASLTSLETAVTLPGNSSLTWYNLGVARSLGGNASKAVDAYDHALFIDKNCTSCQQMKGKSLAGLMRYEESCSAFDAAIVAYPKAYLWSGVCNLTTSRCAPLTESNRNFNTRKLADIEEQLKKRQDDSVLWNWRGEYLNDLMRYDEAVISFERALSTQPGNAVALNGKGVAMFYQGDNAQALDAFSKASVADPEFINPWNNRAFVLMKQEQYEEATKSYEKALQIARQRIYPNETGDFIFGTAV